MRCSVARGHGRVFKLQWASSSASSDVSEPRDPKCMPTHAHTHSLSLSLLPHTHPRSTHGSFGYRCSNSYRKHERRGKQILGTERQNAIAWMNVLIFEDESGFYAPGLKKGQRQGAKMMWVVGVCPTSSKTIHN